MMNFLRKHQYKIFLFTMVTFLGGTFIGFGGYFFSGKSSGDTLLEVNGDKVPLRLFYSHYRQATDQAKPGSLDAAGRQQKRDEVIRDLVQSVVFEHEAERYGVHVPDAQVAMSIAQVPAFQENGAFSPRLYMQALQSQIQLAPKDFEEEQRRNLAFFKLRWLIQSAIKTTDEEAAMVYAMMPPQSKKGTFEKEKHHFMAQLWQEKVLWSFNQWFNQLGQSVKVQTHLDLLEGIK